MKHGVYLIMDGIVIGAIYRVRSLLPYPS